MRRFKATIELYVQLPDEGGPVPADYTGPRHLNSDEPYADDLAALADGIGDTMRALVDDSFIIDWTYAPDGKGGYRYAEPFEGMTPEEEYQASINHALGAHRASLD